MGHTAARKKPKRSARYALCGKFNSLTFDNHDAEEYGELRAHLDALGTPIGPNDLLIASIALAKSLTLVTHNTKEFGRVPRLKLEDWQ